MKYANSHEQRDEIPAELPESPHPAAKKYLDDLITQQGVARDPLLWALLFGVPYGIIPLVQSRPYHYILLSFSLLLTSTLSNTLHI